MNVQKHIVNQTEIAEVVSDKVAIQNTQDALDLMGSLYYQGFDRVILYEKNLTPDFFDLKNRMAGDILQKFSNYRMRLAIIGDFSKFTSRSLRDFIGESNRGRQVNFAPNLKAALDFLAG